MGQNGHSLEKRGLRKRSPVVNEIFYPDCPEILAGKLASWGLTDGSTASAEGSFSGGQVIIAPHGAWDLTGSIAASAFAAVQKNRRKTGRPISKILLLGAQHHAVEEGIFLSDSVSFETPLGNLFVTQKLNRELASCSTLIRVNDIPHLSEHSLEVLLPMIKYCFPAAKIVPILMAGTRPVLSSGLASALRIVFEDYMEESLIVISSNASRNSEAAKALFMAEEFGSLLEKMDSKALLEGLVGGRVSACGGGLVAAMLESGLLEGRHFSTLCPLANGIGENGETVYYGVYIA
jgi:AmmeMemoRadiSam system protein B